MFKIHHRSINSVEPFEYLEKTASEEYTAGEAVVLASGKVTKCGATAKPDYIAQGPANHKGMVPCIRVLPTTIFEVPAQADQSALGAGSNVTLHTDGLKVTATTTSGVFTLLTPAKAGEACTGYFA